MAVGKWLLQTSFRKYIIAEFQISIIDSGDHILWKTDPMYKITVTQAVPTVILVQKNHGRAHTLGKT